MAYNLFVGHIMADMNQPCMNSANTRSTIQSFAKGQMSTMRTGSKRINNKMINDTAMPCKQIK